MSLRPGIRLGPYEIVAHIGAGGMGEVYRARDTRLGRSVAIKVLSAEFAADAHQRMRLEREAKTISALNHPHICTLHDIGRENGIEYLVMEYCEGSTLGERLLDGPFALEQVFDYGIQIADALDKAHRQRIIHRDLKPSNIMLTKSGVKLLDFGLAKRHADVFSGSTGSISTLEQPVSEEGTIIGTLQYMAPEVLAGKEADARSDIFALGLVLYEMTTGQKAFPATSKASLIAAILEREPRSITELKPATPAALDRLIRACLAKDPDERIQTAHDVKLQLGWIREGVLVPRERDRVGPRTKWTVPVMIGATIVVAVATFWIGVRVERGRKVTAIPAQNVTRSVVDLHGGPPLAFGSHAPPFGFFSNLIALSPDASVLIYVGASEDGTQLFQRRLDSVGAKPIPGTGGAVTAFFSPDGKWVGFLTKDKVMKVALAGGAPVALADASTPSRAVWSADGFITVMEMGSTFRVSQDGGPAERLSSFYFSDVLPDGRTLLSTIRLAETGGDFNPIVAYDPRTKKTTPLVSRGYDARYVAPGYLLFARGGDLHIIRFDAKTLKTLGDSSILQSGVAMESYGHRAQFTVSNQGDLAYVAGNDRSVGVLAWVDGNGGSELLNLPSRLYRIFELSPDGRKVAAEVTDVTRSIWIFDLMRGQGRRLPIRDHATSPVWMPDSQSVIFAVSASENASEIVKMDIDDNTMTTLYSGKSLSPLSISADGRVLLARGRGRGNMSIIRLEDRSVRSLQLNAGSSALSPDGRWIAYAASPGGTREIWVSQIETLKETHQISAEGGYDPRWCQRCPELFYRKGSQWYAVRYSSTRDLKWESPRPVWRTDFIDTPGTSFDVSPDGKRLLVSKPTTPDITDRIQLVQNWSRLLPELQQ